MNCPDFVSLCLCVLPFSICVSFCVLCTWRLLCLCPASNLQFFRRPNFNFVYCHDRL